MNFIDAHAHLNSHQFENNWKDVVTKAKNNGVVAIINNGSDLNDSAWAIEQATLEPIVYATVGYHPEYLTGQPLQLDQLVNNLRRLVNNSPKVLAVGELGLDYTLDLELAPKAIQYQLIEAQLALAAEINRPVVLHVRDQKGAHHCFEDMIRLLQQYPTLTGQFHCWTGNQDQADQALSMGFYLSFGGILTYPTAGHIVNVAASLPVDRLLIETDSPYLIPEPRRTQVSRGQDDQTNCQPSDVIMVAEKLAAIRQTSTSEIAAATTANAERLFGLEPSNITQ